MTTIAWDGKTLAADGCAGSDDTLVQGGATKIFKIKGKLVGYAGGYEDGLIFVDWVKRGMPADDKPTVGGGEDDDFAGLIVNRRGQTTEYASRLFGHPAGKPAAIGTGAAAALGAMLAGADALTAVKIAAKVDKSTRSPFRALTLD